MGGMKRTLVLLSLFVLVFVGLASLWLAGDSNARPERAPVRAEEAALDSMGGGLVDAASAASDDRRGIADTTSDSPGDPPDRRPGGKGRSLRLHSRTEFLLRLKALGLEVSPADLDALSEQRADLGAVIVLVTDEEDGLVQGARVVLEEATAANLMARVGGQAFSEGARRARTDRDGLASFSNVPVASFLLAVDHPSYLTQARGAIETEGGRPTFVEVVLSRADARIEGRVVDEHGASIAGVDVAAFRYVEGGVPYNSQAISDFEGAFELRVLGGTRSRLTASKLGYRDATLDHVAAGTRDALLVLEESGTVRIRGRVVAGSSGEPLPLFSIDGEEHRDPGGAFEVERSVSEEPVVLVFDAPDHEPATRSVDTSEGEDVDLGDVPLHGHRELVGIVLLMGEEGTASPVAGASVSVSEEGEASQVVATNSEGLFRVEGLEAETVALSVTAEEAAPHDELVTLLEGEPTYVEVVLERGEYAARGVVLDDESGEPVEGASVEVVEAPHLSTTTDATGAFELRGLPEASFTLRAQASGYRDLTSELLDASEEAALWEARLRPSGLRLRLTLGGAPAAGVEVVLWERIAPTLEAALAAQANLDEHRLVDQTDEAGEVTFDVEDGDWFVQVVSHHLLPTLVTADPESSEWRTLELPGRTRLEARVRYADGQPVANTSVWLHSGDQDYSTMMLYHTDAAGGVVVPNLAPRVYALSIVKSVADQSAQFVHEFTASGAPVQDLELTLPPLLGSVRGRLVDEEGGPRAGVMIGVEYLDAPHRSILAGWVGTDADGRFDVPRLEAGRHILRTAWTDDVAVFSEEFVLAEGEELELDLVMPRVPGARISGRMIAADGGPLGGNFLFATDEAGRQNGNFFSSMEWGYVGPFEIKGLAPGAYLVDLTAMGCVKRREQVSVGGDVSGLVVPMERE